jgi:riboflavin biosynthesis pyrimidine reductase
VGGPKLAASLGKLGLVDEYQIYLRPFVLRKGAPCFAEAQPPLRLVSSDRVGEDAMRLMYVGVSGEQYVSSPAIGGFPLMPL